MAFGGNQYGGTFTTNCLDDIPFKLGPKFKMAAKVVLPPELEAPMCTKALDVEYTFEVEEAVLKWSAEREKQLTLQRNRHEQAKSGESSKVNSTSEDADSDDEHLYENQTGAMQPLYENTRSLQRKPVPPPRLKPNVKDIYANVIIPNPLIANISNGILQPTPSNRSSNESIIGSNNGETKSETNKTSKSSDIDLTWFEKEDDPFDNLELQTINDLEELASVLEETKKLSPEPIQTVVEADQTKEQIIETNIEKEQLDVLLESETNNQQETDDDSESAVYENVELKLVGLKQSATASVQAENEMSSLKNLPPVPPRRDLAGHCPPLPPIGKGISEPSLSSLANHSSEKQHEEGLDSLQTFQCSETSKVISKRRTALPMPLPKPPRTFKYSRNMDEIDATDESDEPKYANLQPNVSIDCNNKQTSVQFTTNRVANDSKILRSSSEELSFVNHHYGEDGNAVSKSKRPITPQRPAPVPPPRPQSWSRYSPLPPTTRPEENRLKSDKSTNCRAGSPDLYSQLSKESKACVDRLTSMGFPKDRVSRAVQKIGLDEKEVVEYLCLVDQLIEKGYSTYLAENALLLFENSMQQACAYLELYSQMQELGFNSDKIKEALVNTNNDREKALDILTASS